MFTNLKREIRCNWTASSSKKPLSFTENQKIISLTQNEKIKHRSFTFVSVGPGFIRSSKAEK